MKRKYIAYVIIMKNAEVTGLHLARNMILRKRLSMECQQDNVCSIIVAGM